MNAPTRKTVLMYLAATFLVGAVAGGAVGYGIRNRPVFRPMDRDEMRVKMCAKFTTELELNPEQQKLLDPLVRKGMDEFEAAQREHKAHLRELMKQGRERTSAILTPEQRVKFEAMERERESRMQSRPKGSGGPH